MYGKLQVLDLSLNNLTRTLPPVLCSGNNLHILIALRNFLFLWLVRKQIKNVGKQGRVFGWQENNGKWQKWERGLTEVEIGFFNFFLAPLAIYEVEVGLGFYWVGTLSWNFLLSWRILIGPVISHYRNCTLLNSSWYDPFRYDIALGINTFGALQVLSFAKKCIKLTVPFHVSTSQCRL